MSALFGSTSNGIEMLIVSPPFIQVPVDATRSLTRMYCFFMAFLSADLVEALLNMPTPYSCSLMGAVNDGTVWLSVVSILVV